MLYPFTMSILKANVHLTVWSEKDVLDLNTNIAQTVYLEIANSVTPPGSKML